MKKSFRFLGLLFVATMLLCLPMVTLAAGSADENVFVPKDRVVSTNYFQAGNSIDISGTLEKDAYLAGQVITVDGVIKGDLFGAGNVLRINGTVEGSVRFAGQTVIINGKVGRNIMVLGNTLVISPDANIGWDTMFVGNLLEIKGDVAGSVLMAGSMLKLDGNVAGMVNTEVDSLTLSDSAKVGGNVEYKSAKDADISESAVVGGEIIKKDYTAVNKKIVENNVGKAMVAYATAWLMFSLLSLFVIALVMIGLMRKLMEYGADMALKGFWRLFGIGFLILIVTPIGALLLMFTVIGIPLALIVLAIYFVALCIAKVMFAYILMKLLFKWSKAKKEWHPVWMVLVGLLIFVLIRMIPIVGWVFGFIGLCVGLGSIFEMKKKVLKSL